MSDKRNKLDWLDEFERLANDVLGHQEGAACRQVHPIIKQWYEEIVSEDFPESRDSVMQAMACLTTELIADMPEEIFQVLSQSLDEEEVAVWLHEILMVGRLFEQALNKGRLDDL